MMPHPKLPKAHREQYFFASLDRLQRLARDRQSVSNPRRKAGRGRLVPNAKARMTRQRANIFLRKPNLSQRSEHAMVRRRLLPRTKIAPIIQIHAVSNVVEMQRSADALHHLEKLVFAMKTARAIILRIVRIFKFVRVDHLQRNPLLLGKLHRIAQMRARQARRIGDHRKHLIAQHLMCSISKKGRIDSARVSHHQPPDFAQPAIKRLALLDKLCR